MMRFCIALLLSVLALVRTDRFSLSAIQGPCPVSEEVGPSRQVLQILDQPFHYLARGRQAFVFESADGKYVLKFFDQRYFNLPWYTSFFPKEKKKRAERRRFYEQSYAIANREFGEGIVYLHMALSNGLPSIVVSNRTDVPFVLNLDKIPFVLQKKAIPLYEGFRTAFQRGGEEGLSREVEKYLAKRVLRIEKGIADGDSDVEHNWGYIEGEIVQLDPGRLYYEDFSKEERVQKEWDCATRKLARWLEREYHFSISFAMTER
jgi:hypothetical protein